MARLIREAGAEPFIDLFDLASGDRFEDVIKRELAACDELVALLTPWSVERNWVWTEIAAAWCMNKRYVGILYGLTLREIDAERGGAACLQPTTVASLDTFDDYLRQLATRAAGSTGTRP